MRLLALIILLSLSVAGPSMAAFTDAQTDTISQYFDQFVRYCSEDNGRLWNQSLCVPIAVIDPHTRTIVTSQPDSAGLLRNSGSVWIGTWPPELPIANSSIDWLGKRWTTLVWPLPESEIARRSLMLHEAFHNVQDNIGIPAKSPDNSHLGSRDGRLLLRLEWAALAEALVQSGEDRKRALYDALIFRRYRNSLFPGSAEPERLLELHEGLAEYTGLRLSGLALTEAMKYLADTLLPARLQDPSLERSFAYFSGPAYAFLLESREPGWRNHFTAADDLSDLTRAAYDIVVPLIGEAETVERGFTYGIDTVRTQEEEREAGQQAIIEAYRERLVNGSVLKIPLQNMNLQFDPRSQVGLGEDGTVYPTITVSDDWGILTVTAGGALMAPDWSTLRIPIPSEISPRSVSGDGFTLTLSENWQVVPIENSSNMTLRNR